MLIPMVAIIHAIVFLVGIGYAQNYYFHLRKLNDAVDGDEANVLQVTTRTMLIRWLCVGAGRIGG
jgi:hypothetical protein